MTAGVIAYDCKEPATFDEVGIFADVPYEHYHLWPGLRKTNLWIAYRRTLAHYKYKIDHPDPDTTEFIVGHASHVAILQPELFEKLYCKPPDSPSGAAVWDRRFKAHKEAWAEWLIDCAKQGWVELSADEYELSLHLRDAVWASPVGKLLLEGAATEVSIQWKEIVDSPAAGTSTELLVKTRLDAINKGVITDVKTTRDADPRIFGSQAYKLGYHYQMAQQKEGVRSASGQEPGECYLLAVEKDPPYLVKAYCIEPEDLAIGRTQFRISLQLISGAMRTGEWRGYGPDPSSLVLPSYAGSELSG